MKKSEVSTQVREASVSDVAPERDSKLSSFPLLAALRERRSRRFAKGMALNGGPLAYRSTAAPDPLSVQEEAALVFAACGITGYALAELPYETGDVPEAATGNMMGQFLGRTAPSADALHNVALVVLNDEGASIIRRPQDFPKGQIADLVRDARDERLVELYMKSRVRFRHERPDPPRVVPFVLPPNKWSANVPGTSYFLPVNELSALYINLLLASFDEDCGYFIIDDRNNFRPAGVGRFTKSRGGHLHDDPDDDRIVPMSILEGYLLEFVAIEQGAILQNLGLMTQALGLGGFMHFAAHPFTWFETLGFRMEELPVSRVLSAAPFVKLGMRLLKKDLAVPTPVGLEHKGETLLKPFCPPYYKNMEEAVLAFIDMKFAEGQGSFRDGGQATAWRDGERVQRQIPKHSDRAIEATIAFCDYVYKRYGRFPPHSGPFRTIMAYQAHRLDYDFYDRFYRPDALGEAQRRSRAT